MDLNGDWKLRLTDAGKAMVGGNERLDNLNTDETTPAIWDGTWPRLKACPRASCQWAFYDRSRNHGGTWCDMATCGNKLKNREFRARRTKR